MHTTKTDYLCKTVLKQLSFRVRGINCLWDILIFSTVDIRYAIYKFFIKKSTNAFGFRGERGRVGGQSYNKKTR